MTYLPRRRRHGFVTEVTAVAPVRSQARNERRKTARMREKTDGQCRLVYQSGIVGGSLPFSTLSLLDTSRLRATTTQSFLSFWYFFSTLFIPPFFLSLFLFLSFLSLPLPLRISLAANDKNSENERKKDEDRGYLFKEQLYSKRRRKKKRKEKWLSTISRSRALFV